MTCRYGKQPVAALDLALWDLKGRLSPKSTLPGGSAFRLCGSQVPADVARLTSIAVLAGGRTPSKRPMERGSPRRSEETPAPG